MIEKFGAVPTLVGGDLLSTVRARGAVYIRGRSELQEDYLKGLLYQLVRIGMEKFASWRYVHVVQ